MNDKITLVIHIAFLLLICRIDGFSQAPETPNTSFTVIQKCGVTNVTRNSAPTSDQYWYWLPNASSTDTSWGNSSTFSFSNIDNTVGVSHDLYLRARSKQSPFAWSNSAQFVGSVSVGPSPCGTVELSGPTVANVGDEMEYTAIFKDLSGVPVSPPANSSTDGISVSWNGGPGEMISFTETADYTAKILWDKPGFFQLIYEISTVDDDYFPNTQIIKTLVVNVLSSFPQPNLTYSNNGIISNGGSVNLSVSNFTYDSYQWYKDNQLIQGATTSAYTTNQPGVYKIQVTKGNETLTSSQVTVVYSSSFEEKNYVETSDILSANVTTINSVDALSVHFKQRTIRYFDGIGRPIQEVKGQASPLMLDIVQPIAYDKMGRESIRYLPFVNGYDGTFKFRALKDANQTTGTDQSKYRTGSQYTFYQAGGNLPSDRFPYSESEYEESPLNRRKRIVGSGENWRYGNTVVSTKYLLNVHGSSSGQEKIIAFMYGANRRIEVNKLLVADNEMGYYPSGKLSIKSVVDENGNEVREYTDSSGKLILKKIYVKGSKISFNLSGNWAETYYIYDDYGNLVVVLPPEGVERMKTINWTY